jgi:hypothetical protein
MHARRGTPEGDRLDVLVTLRWSKPGKPSTMRSTCLTRSKRSNITWSRKARVYEVLNRKRSRMVWRLHIKVPEERVAPSKRCSRAIKALLRWEQQELAEALSHRHHALRGEAAAAERLTS